MGIKAKYLLNRISALTVTVSYEEDGAVKDGAITVRHRCLTPELSAKLTQGKAQTARDGSDDEEQGEVKANAKDALVVELVQLLVNWDVEGDDGAPLPISEETLSRLDYKVLREIDAAIYRYTFPNSTT